MKQSQLVICLLHSIYERSTKYKTPLCTLGSWMRIWRRLSWPSRSCPSLTSHVAELLEELLGHSNLEAWTHSSFHSRKGIYFSTHADQMSYCITLGKKAGRLFKTHPPTHMHAYPKFSFTKYFLSLVILMNNRGAHRVWPHCTITAFSSNSSPCHMDSSFTTTFDICSTLPMAHQSTFFSKQRTVFF